MLHASCSRQLALPVALGPSAFFPSLFPTHTPLFLKYSTYNIRSFQLLHESTSVLPENVSSRGRSNLCPLSQCVCLTAQPWPSQCRLFQGLFWWPPNWLPCSWCHLPSVSSLHNHQSDFLKHTWSFFYSKSFLGSSVYKRIKANILN